MITALLQKTLCELLPFLDRAQVFGPEDISAAVPLAHELEPQYFKTFFAVSDELPLPVLLCVYTKTKLPKCQQSVWVHLSTDFFSKIMFLGFARNAGQVFEIVILFNLGSPKIALMARLGFQAISRLKIWC